MVTKGVIHGHQIWHVAIDDMVSEAVIYNHQLDDDVESMWHSESLSKSSQIALSNNTYSRTVNITAMAVQESNLHILNSIEELLNGLNTLVV